MSPWTPARTSRDSEGQRRRVGGELIGNIENAKRVELLEGGVINGDVKAGSLTVAAGSRMRGQVEFGYEGETAAPSRRPKDSVTHERRLSPGRAGQDAYVSALQGDDPRKPEYLPGLPAPPALRPGSSEASGGGHFGAARRGADSSSAAGGAVGILRHHRDP